MPKLGLTTSLGSSGLTTPGVVTDGLVMKHMYPAGAVQPLSDGTAYFVAENNDNIDITEFTLDTDGNCSIMFWWKYNGAGASPWAVLGHTSQANEQHLRFVGTANLKLESDTADDECVIGLNTAFTDNNWHHYAVICTSGTVTAFQDGASCTIGTGSGNNVMTADTPFNLIGAQFNTTNNYNLDGYICNLGIWSVALTQPQIKSIMFKEYTDLSTSESENLVSWWNLDNVPATTNYSPASSETGALQYEDGASGSVFGANVSTLDFVPTNDIELGADIFGGEGTFSSDTGYWNLNSSTIDNGLVITGTDSYNAIAKGSILTDGKIYKLSWDIIDYVDEGALKLKFNWAQDSTGDAYPTIWTPTGGKGSFYCYFEPGGNTATQFTLYVYDAVNDYGMIKLDNLVCQEVLNAGVLK